MGRHKGIPNRINYARAIKRLWNRGHSPQSIQQIFKMRGYFLNPQFLGGKTPEAILSFIQQRCREFESESRAERDVALPASVRGGSGECAGVNHDGIQTHSPANKESGLSAAIVFCTQCERVERISQKGSETAIAASLQKPDGVLQPPIASCHDLSVKLCGIVEGHEEISPARTQFAGVATGAAESTAGSENQASPARNSTPKSLGTPEIGKGSLNTGATITSVASVPTPRNSTPTLEKKPPISAKDEIIERMMRLSATPKQARQK